MPEPHYPVSPMSEQPPTIGIGLIGYGTVGRGVAHLIKKHTDMYAQRVGKQAQIRSVLVRTPGKATEYAQTSDDIDPAIVTNNADTFFAADVDIVIEVAGGTTTAGDYIRRALSAGKHVVSANKALLAKDGKALCALARENNVALAYEASCAGGIPIIAALTQGLMANHVDGLYGILNGTCNYILTQMIKQGWTYEHALKTAQDLGYAEADPALDVSGMDAGQKLAILAGIAFCIDSNETHLNCTGIDTISLDDVKAGQELGYDIKLLGIAEQGEDGRVALGVEPCFVHDEAILAQVHGAFNAVSVVGDAVGHVLLYGQGAGQMPTASAVVADLLDTLSGGYPAAFKDAGWTPDRGRSFELLPPEDVQSRYYLRVDALDAPGTLGKLTTALGKLGIGISAVSQHESADGTHDGHLPVVLLTDKARRGDIDTAIAEFAQSGLVQGTPRVIRVVDLP